jgi:Zn-dependent protease
MVFFLLNLTRDSILSIFGLVQYSHLFIFEIIDMIIMALAIGYIFSGFLRKPTVVQGDNYDPLKHYSKKSQRWENIKFAALAAGPAVILHELAHKFVAMSFGAKAVLYAPYGFYLLVILLKAIGFPFIFFVGGFVAHTALPPFQSSIVALAGPLTNFLMWLIITISIKNNSLKKKYYPIAVPLARISLFLAIFNMLPLPGFDGFNFFSNLFSFIF